VVLRSEHEDLEPPLLAVGLEHPDPLDGLAVELSLVVDGVHPDVLLLEPHGRRVLVETALQLKLPHRVLPLPLHVPHRDRVDEKVGEVHWSLLIVLLVVSVPLSDLLKVGHGRRCAT
jgi:hypothetical protein